MIRRFLLTVMLFMLLWLTGCSMRGVSRIDTQDVPDIPGEYFLCFHMQKKSALIGGFGYLMVLQENNRVRCLKTFPCSYGENGWPKRREGDRRTPVGKYQIVRVNEKGRSNRFGPYSILIDYPNHLDRMNGYTGSLIAIHGGRVSKTYGCIRVLDGTGQKPRFGRLNITLIRDRCPAGTKVFLLEDVKSEMLAHTGEELSGSVSRKWIRFLEG